MSVQQRIKEFITYKKMSVRAFEREVGLSYGYINNMRVSIQPDKVSNIAHCFPDLNTGWLLTGEGEMLKVGPEPPQANEPATEYKKQNDIYPRMIAIIESQQAAIAKLSDAALIHARNIEKLIARGC